MASLDEPQHLAFGHALAPLSLRSAQAHASDLARRYPSPASVAHLRPSYAGDGYIPRRWERTTHLVPASTPRSSYSAPLAGGESLPELPLGTHERIRREPKHVDSLPFFQDRIGPLPGPYVLGTTEDDALEQRPPPTLVVDRLVPRSGRTKGGAILVAAHGLGFCKETWLPVLDRLLDEHGQDEKETGIDQVWLLDAVGHGMTALLNRFAGSQPAEGDELLSSHHRIVDSNDYARDLALLCTCFLPFAIDDEEPPTALRFAPPRHPTRPLVGLGHSFGATSLLQLSIHVPRLFAGLCVVEPILIRESLVNTAMKIPLARVTAMKRDGWASRDEARRDFVADKRGMARWDAAVLDSFVAGGLFAQPPSLPQGQGAVRRSCDVPAEALCIRGNRPGIQLASGTLRHVPKTTEVLYISCAKPLLLPLDEVRQTAETALQGHLAWCTLDGSHALVQERPGKVGEELRRWLRTSGGGRGRSRL